MRRRWWLLGLVGVTVLGLVVRVWRLNRVELQHWDEGAYCLLARRLVEARNVDELLDRSDPPYDPRYAPPLFPLLVAGAFGLFGVSAFMAVLVSALSGTAAVVVLFLLIRRVWGPAAGLFAALFLALCEYHLVYSRMALTDALFATLMLLALLLFVRALEGGEEGEGGCSGRVLVRRYLLAGVAVGLCQNTKYHGLAVLGVVGLYLAVAWLGGRATDLWGRWWGGGRGCWRVVWWRHWVGLTAAAVLALLLYLPWALIVEWTIGYRNLLSHTLGFASLSCASLSLLAAYVGRFVSPGVLVLAAVGVGVMVAGGGRRARLVVVGLLVFALAPAFYFPYPRLLLPAVVLACGVGGVGMVWLFALKRGGGWRVARVAGAVVLALGISADALRRAGPVLRAEPAGYARAAAAVGRLLRFHPTAEVWADLQHCFRFYLSPEVRCTVRRIKTSGDAVRFIRSQPFPRILVVDLRVLRHRRDAPVFLDYLAALDRLRPSVVLHIPNPLNDVTLLNTLNLTELEEVRAWGRRGRRGYTGGASSAGAALARRAMTITVYLIPAGWEPG